MTGDIKRFDMNSIVPNTSIVCLGKPQTGKTVLVADIRHKVGSNTKITELQYAKRPLGSYFDYTFIFRETNLNSRKTIYENFAGAIPTFELFCKIMDEMADKYTVLVIDNRQTYSDLKDLVFWYKADLTDEPIAI